MRETTKLEVLRDYLERELWETRTDYNYYKSRCKSKEVDRLLYGLYMSIQALENALEMVKDMIGL